MSMEVWEVRNYKKLQQPYINPTVKTKEKKRSKFFTEEDSLPTEDKVFKAMEELERPPDMKNRHRSLEFSKTFFGGASAARISTAHHPLEKQNPTIPFRRLLWIMEIQKEKKKASPMENLMDEVPFSPDTAIDCNSY
ncbi:hypothetical protein RclHR1_28650002 [Rhizophagus clarus]|uniref:Uncharacterized protein n=1 Tax=Rhizophagus clarus TaxID=94130 RepID=A0A2Z6R7L0_9GLOM|nr:hypothetical protein RclHR1_28650002 [Rhizophagus clarus]GES83283.1 hypothetical protein RCL_jg15992.t1 [Rhizophagus clarus]